MRRNNKDSEKKKTSLEAQITMIIQGSLKKAINEALKEILKEWK